MRGDIELMRVPQVPPPTRENPGTSVKIFNYSRRLGNVVNLTLKLNTVLQIFAFICSKRVQVHYKAQINWQQTFLN